MQENPKTPEERSSYLEKHLSEKQIRTLYELAQHEGYSLWDLICKAFESYHFIKSYADRYLGGNEELLKELCGSYFEYFHKKDSPNSF